MNIFMAYNEDEYLKLLEEETEYLRTHKLENYRPSPKQKDFHEASSKYREVLFMAANQSGKTYAGAMEVAYHLTGQYPDWWTGRRFDKPNIWWVAGESGETTRDNPQRLLMGDIGEEGTGSIPKDCIGRKTAARGISDLIDHVQIKHVSGGWSHLYFKFYGKGALKWVGQTLDGIWFDEEPPLAVYTEGLTRTNKKRGQILVTFTPLLGMSDVVMRFWQPDPEDAGSKNRIIISMTIHESEQYTEEQIKEIESQYPDYEKEARTKGVPFLGSGRVFPVSEESIMCDPFEIPKFWARIIGLDFGWGDHPTAAAYLAHDRDSDTIYVTAVYRSKEIGIGYHASRLRTWGNVPVAWPHDGLQKDKKSGVQIRQIYSNHGLRMRPEHAQFPDKRGNGLEASIASLLERMKSGRFKVFSTCQEFFDEFRIYHRKEGIVVPRVDDVISAVRYGEMEIRGAMEYEPPPQVHERYSTKPRRGGSWLSR